MFLPGESHGQRRLAGHSPQSRRELDTTKVTEHAQSKMRIAGSYRNSIFSCLRHFHIVVFHGGWPIYIPTNSVQGFPFLNILANICYLCSFWWWPFWQVWSDISLWFWFVLLWWLAMLSIFSWTCCPSAISSLEKCLFSLLGSFVFSDVELYELFTYVGY